MSDDDPIGDLMGKPIHAFGYPTPDKHPGYNPVVNEQSVRITRIFQPVTVDPPSNEQPWHGVVERISYSETTGRVTIELWSTEAFEEHQKAMEMVKPYVRRIGD